MKSSSITQVVSSALLTALLALIATPARTANAGEIAANFSLPYRGQPGNLNLYDFAGQVILLEFFFATCPHCQNAAPYVKTDIIEHFNNNGGNAQGLPVTVLHLNIGWFVNPQSLTDSFIAQHEIEHVADDFNYFAFNRAQFGGGSGTPTFVTINGTTNSTSHQQWEIVDVEAGWLDANPAQSVSILRAAVNAVQGPPASPSIGPAQLVDGKCRFTVTGHAGIDVCIESTIDFETWNPIVTLPNPSGTITFTDGDPASDDLRVYRAILK